MLDRDTSSDRDARAEDLLTSRPAQPRSLIVTIYGLYARATGGWLSVASLIRLLAALSVDEPAVRSSISRLKRRGILVPERQDGAAGYALSEEARAILAEGDRRIFRPRAASPDEGWVLVVFGVPETERAKRHTLRSRLSWLGFGTVAPGVWVAPAHLADEALDVLGRLGLSDFVDLFAAQYLPAGDLREHVASWWDLEQLRDLYGQYTERWEPVLGRWRQRRRFDREEAFVDYVSTLTAWRRLPYLDPGLPTELLPDGWPGTRAAEVFLQLHERLKGPSREHVDAVRRQ